MSTNINPPTMSTGEHMRTLIGMLTASITYRESHDPTEMIAAVDEDMNQADYMSLLGLSIGLLFNSLTSLGVDPRQYLAMLTSQVMEAGGYQ